MELEHRTVVAIGAGPRHGVEHATCRSAELCGVGVGQHLKFEHRLDAEQHARGRARRLVVDVADVGAVEQETVHLGTGSVDRDLRSPATHHVVAGGQRRLDAGLHQRQLLKLSAIERQIAYFPHTDDAADRAGGQVD